MNPSDHAPISTPALPDVKSCEAWLARAALADSRQAGHAFLSLLDDLEDAPPGPLAYFSILERLYQPIRVAQEDLARKFLGKSLPLGHAENAAFHQVCDLWLSLLRAYRHLLRAAINGQAGLEPLQALLAQRSLGCTGEMIGAHLFARREIDGDLWHWLHEIWTLVEAQGFADAEVALPDNPESPGATSSCTSTYVWPLLLMLANPYSLPARELQWAMRWSRGWAYKVRLSRECEKGEGYAVDLSVGAGAAWKGSAQTGEGIRFIETTSIVRSLKYRARMLADGAMPGTLSLGRDCSQPAAGKLLASLASWWSDAPSARQFPRRTSSARSRLVSGAAEIHFALSGRRFSPDARPWDYSRRDVDQIHVFQRAVDFASRQSGEPTFESWDALDESATGFRLRHSGPVTRVAQRQLVALQPRGARQLILCEVLWLIQGSDQSLTIGTRALPGLPQPCAIRAVAEGAAGREPRFPGFLLPIAPGLPPSLVLPAGWYQSERLLELEFEQELLRIRLASLLARGYDYDRVNFAVIS